LLFTAQIKKDSFNSFICARKKSIVGQLNKKRLEKEEIVWSVVLIWREKEK